MPERKAEKGKIRIPEDYPDRFLDCRVDRHAWARMRVMDPDMNVPYGYGVYRQCNKCGSIWIRSYDHSMTRKVYERRLYAPGYLLTGVGYADTRPKPIHYLRMLIEREQIEFINPENYIDEG